ncbi:MAG: carbon-nitrogen hydrolase family protein [Gammaproteobacteria bacterium]|nr:carbon-nitrogen hydrolase family protein [Gammaproteobacteria bacterium]
MSSPFKIALVQNRAGTEMAANIDACEALVREASRRGAELVCLPELFSCFDVRGRTLEAGAFAEASHPALARFRDVARELRVWIQLGSLAVRLPSGRQRNRALMLDERGEIVASYDKVHMFDVDLADGERYRESESFECGDRAVLADTPWGRVGMTVCYDLRFAYLYRMLAQAGASYLTVPAAFMRTTGQAHWHVLLRARAIETGCYVFAACQWGRHGDAVTYGHSLVVDPWGEVIAEAGAEEECVLVAEVDPARVITARARIPALEHDRPVAPPETGADAPRRASA